MPLRFKAFSTCPWTTCLQSQRTGMIYCFLKLEDTAGSTKKKTKKKGGEGRSTLSVSSLEVVVYHPNHADAGDFDNSSHYNKGLQSTLSSKSQTTSRQ